MDRALRLAGLADGLTSPNPLVGAVVLSAAGELVGEGYHRKAGEAHAELMALQQAGSKAKGGSLYVTLEPCCHQGRTPPCTDAVLSSGVKRVVVAIADPNPLVAGKGLKLLREAGLEVELGEGAEAAKKQNSAFLHRINTGKPEGILKWAMSLDGRTALPNGASQWISGPEARSWVHQLRSRCDAVIVGGGTVRADDPLLTSRGRRTPEPLRVVVSRELNLPQNAQLWNQELAPTLVAHGPGAKAEKIALLDQLGIERLPLDRCEPQQLMEALANRGCNRVLWECGPELAAGAIGQGCVQHIAAVIAPKLLGGIAACTPLGDLGFLSMEQAIALSAIQKINLYKEILVTAKVN
ncbi:MAG: bifunctional diaminohydroxyphosphoribosylaminopyrimidine deaminase/5-amino-6-(5-phosphoribosylamino)uracil reductase RibD [Synechococcaceae bacterium WBA_2_066]|nr:bifunctional diaminohydroxyphosphoribosylaminopyrimidine deaminase/5-amino-6-(5-phosphoribosylamino)uracil reductase RibD [Synechococcaceae bacterium WB9_2_069]NDE38275.1 bifunctional diaminohydroxyphosphoribosylaminopyrimidine deaminase/5-amino-6-(5-phosphoribosylamino)uracil reductase RibD [Synechococcaceae bacterium WBA_2_066]